MNSIQVSTAGINKLLGNLKPHKAPGPDNISPRVLKELRHVISPILQVIFQRSLETGHVPDDWREANIAAVFKKGERYKASNYRPISLTAICCKIMEHVIASHIMDHLESHQILYKLQHGFRRLRSCETQLIDMVHQLAQQRNSGTQSDLIIMDFAKAFDKVSHSRLLLKLDHYGIRGKTLQWISSFLRNRSQRVVLEGESSETAPVTSGVPQGTVLGPILFLIFINDLPDHAQHCTVRLFADDCVLQMEVRNEDDCLKLQDDIDNIGRWERQWLMEFNPIKCEVMSVPASRNPIWYSYTLHGHELKRTKETKYLGVTIQADLRWNSHVNKTVIKANHTLGLLRRNLKVASKPAK